MPISATYDELSRIALEEFSDIVVQAEIQRLPTDDPRKLRLHITTTRLRAELSF